MGGPNVGSFEVMPPCAGPRTSVPRPCSSLCMVTRVLDHCGENAVVDVCQHVAQRCLRLRGEGTLWQLYWYIQPLQWDR